VSALIVAAVPRAAAAVLVPLRRIGQFGVAPVQPKLLALFENESAIALVDDATGDTADQALSDEGSTAEDRVAVVEQAILSLCEAIAPESRLKFCVFDGIPFRNDIRVVKSVPAFLTALRSALLEFSIPDLCLELTIPPGRTTTSPTVSDVFPLRSEADYERALALVDELWGRPSESDLARLEVLTILVEHYERETDPVRSPTPIEAIEFRLEQLGLSRADLGRILGSRARATEVLNGTRRLTLPMIRKVHDELDVPIDVLVQEMPNPPSRRDRGTPSSTKRQKTPPRRSKKPSQPKRN
jgi:HTH-type transcriptional regulator/antitoxin HigA